MRKEQEAAAERRSSVSAPTPADDNPRLPVAKSLGHLSAR